jgi:taurine dioxygenase
MAGRAATAARVVPAIHVFAPLYNQDEGLAVGASSVTLLCEPGMNDMEANAVGVRASNIQTRPLCPALGAEIIGVDLRDDLDDVFAQILDAWHANLVILLRDQQLGEEDQVRFAEHFGPLARIHTPQFVRTHPAVMLISNIREDGKPIGALPDGEMHFHSDQCYQERPAMGTMLYALEVPRAGGNTLFANAYTAYETLPEQIKRRIDGRRALNAYDYDKAATRRGTRVAEGVPFYVHPVVRTHPATGRKALYVNRLMTVSIEGMADAESDELLETLFDHQERREFVYEHVWRPGDLLLWDNRCTLHARTDFDASERRKLRRVAVLGDVPA